MSADRVADSVARGTLINLATRTAGVVAVLGITALTARISTQAQGTFALFTSVEGVLLADGLGAGVLVHGVSVQAIVSVRPAPSAARATAAPAEWARRARCPRARSP